MAYLCSIGDREAIKWRRELAREQNPNLDEELKKLGVIECKLFDMTPILKKQEQKRKAKKLAKRMEKNRKTALPIYDFCVNTAVEFYCKKLNFDMLTGFVDVESYNYSRGCKHIYCQNKYKNTFNQVCFYTQNFSPNLLNLEENKKNIQSFDIIKIISFRKKLDYYITKNSFIRNIRKSEYLFSFDNIVIDVDNHSEDMTVEQITEEVNKLVKCLDNTKDFLKYSVVRTGRGVQMWIRLESFSARTSTLQRLYVTFCEKLCDVVERVIQDNNINLELDRGASTDMMRVVRLPYTYNTKAKKKDGKSYKVKYDEHTAQKYSLDDLCKFFKLKKAEPKVELKKAEVSKKSKPFAQNKDEKSYVGLHYKRISFFERLAKNTPIGEGRCNWIMYFYYISCRKIYSADKSKELATRLNNAFADPLKQTELKANFRSIDKKIESGITFNPSNEHIFEEIKATESEIALYNVPTENELKRQEQRKQAREKKQEHNQEIRKLSKRNVSADEIANQVGCCKDTVYKYADKQSLDKKIIKLYEKGLKQKDIAKKLNCSEGTVSEVLKPYKQDKNTVVINLFEQSFKQCDIIKQTGYSKNTVSKILKEYKNVTVR